MGGVHLEVRVAHSHIREASTQVTLSARTDVNH